MKLELVSFKEYPDDLYTKAIAVLLVDGIYMVSYGRKITKDGGEYWASPSFGCAGNNGKEYFEGFSMDSKSQDQQIKDFIKSKESELRPTPHSMDEVANAQAMPF